MYRPWSGEMKNYKVGIYSYSAKHISLKSNMLVKSELRVCTVASVN